MKVMVTGGAGFIGSNLTRHLVIQRDCEVLVVDKLTYAGNRASLADLQSHPGLTLSITDICDAPAVSKCFHEFQPDALFHLAAESHVDRSIDDPEAFIQTNLVGTYRLLREARNYCESLANDSKNRFRFIHVSTDEVYGSLDFDASPFSETTPYQPHSPYSASKAGADHLARAWFDTYRLPVIVANCSNNFGPFQFPEKLIPLAILRGITGQEIPVYGSGENIRDWLFVADQVDALWQIYDRGIPGETYNLGGNNERSNLFVVQSICKFLEQLRPLASNEVAQKNRPGLKAYTDLITFVADRPAHDLRYATNTGKIEREVGWKPQTDFEQGLLETVGWYLENESWWREIVQGSYRLERLGDLSIDVEDTAS